MHGVEAKKCAQAASFKALWTTLPQRPSIPWISTTAATFLQFNKPPSRFTLMFTMSAALRRASSAI